MARDLPEGLDAAASLRVVRTFLVVRIVRGLLLLIFLVLALIGVEIRGWPAGIAVAIAVAMLLQAVAVAVHYRRYVRLEKCSRL